MKIQTYGPDAKDITAPHEIHTLGYRPLVYLLNHPGETALQMGETFATLNCVEVTQLLVSEGFLRFGDWKGSFKDSPLYPTRDLMIYILNNFDLTSAERMAVGRCEVVDWNDYFENENWEDVF